MEKPLQAHPVRLSPVYRESRDDKVCTLPGVPPQFLHTPSNTCLEGCVFPQFPGAFSLLSLAHVTKCKGSSDESGGGPQGVFRVEVWNVLFLPCYPIPTWTPSGNTQRRKFMFLILWFNRAAQLIKVVLSCSFSKSLFCFGGVLEHALMLGGSKNALLFHIIYIIKITLSQPGTSGSISSGFDEGTPSEKRNVLWLVSCPSALWLANSLNCVSVLPHPLPKQQVHQYCHSLA